MPKCSLSSSWLMLSTSLCSRMRAPMYLSTALAVLGETFFGFALFTALFTSDDLRIALALEGQHRVRPLNGSEIFPPALAPTLCPATDRAPRGPASAPRGRVRSAAPLYPGRYQSNREPQSHYRFNLTV